MAATPAASAASTTPTTEPQYHWESARYNSYPGWKKGIFWVSVLNWASVVYWLVRLIVYLVKKDEPKPSRLDAYTTQAYVFGWIGIVTVVLIILWVFLIMVAFVSTVPQ